MIEKDDLPIEDDPMLDPREVDLLIARTVAHCEAAGIPPPSPERMREVIGDWDRIVGANVRPGKSH